MAVPSRVVTNHDLSKLMETSNEWIIERTGMEDRIGFCFDTCHAHAAGYDMAGGAQAAAVLDALERTCGLANVRVLHLNDSKGACGSRLDRHEHIERGKLGKEAFRLLLNDPRWASIPMYLETPKTDASGRSMDPVNLRRLRSLVAR